MQAFSMLSCMGFCLQAFDTQTLQEVAVKVHQLNASWPAARKASYVRHAVREYEIHKALRHTNIVALVDIFEIDANTFATVLELCTGGDLDTYLKENQAGLPSACLCHALALTLLAIEHHLMVLDCHFLLPSCLPFAK